MRKLILVTVFLGLAVTAQAQDTSAPFRHHMANYSGVAPSAGGTTKTFAWDFTQTIGATVVTNSGHTMTRGGTPTKVDDGTWPAGLSGSQGEAYTFDGAADYWSRADDGTFDPAGDFSVQCVVTPDTNTVTEMIIGKNDAASADIGWRAMRRATAASRVEFRVCKDAVQNCTVVNSDTMLNGCISFITFTYDYVGDGSSLIKIFNNNEATASSAAAVGPPHDSGADFSIGATTPGGSRFTGKMGYCAFYDGVVITEAEHDADFAGWQGRLDTTGTLGNAIVITAASPPSVQLTDLNSGTIPPYTDVGANSMMVTSSATGSGGFHGGDDITSIAQRGTFETWAAGAATGWTEAGGAAGDATQDTTNVIHGLSSTTLDCSGAADTISITSACLDINPTKDYILQFIAKELTGNSDLNITVYGWSDNACTADQETELTNTPGDITTSWVRYPAGANGLILSTDWEGTSEYVTIVIDNSDDNGVGTLSLDGLMLMEDTDENTTALCVADTDASVSCSRVDIDGVTPFSGSSTWRTNLTYNSPIDGADSATRWLLHVDGTAGNNNRIDWYLASDTLTLHVYDSAGVQKAATVACAADANTDYVLEAWHRYDGGIATCCAGTCGTEVAAATSNAVGAGLCIAGDGSDGSNTLINNVRFFRELSP